MKWGQAAALAAGAATLAWMVAAVGLPEMAGAVALGGPALPAAIAVHAVQLTLAGLGWHAAIGERSLGGLFVARVRWVREGVNTLLPVAHIGGQVVGVRLLVQAGVAPVRAVVGTILDLALEAGSQVLVVLAAAGLLLAMREGDREWLVWVLTGIGVLGLSAVVLVLALRFGVLHLIETGLQRAAARWPGSAAWSMGGLHATFIERQSDHRAMSWGLALNVAGWALGMFEVWVILRALGADPGLEACFVIESLAMAARSAGFAIPGAVGVQEGGFVVACGLFGIGAETALALSVLKRLRELIVGGSAMLVWQIRR